MSPITCSRTCPDAIRLAESRGLSAGQPSGIKAVQHSQTETVPRVSWDQVVLDHRSGQDRSVRPSFILSYFSSDETVTLVLLSSSATGTDLPDPFRSRGKDIHLPCNSRGG